MTTLELLKAAMQDNESIEMRKEELDTVFNVMIYRFTTKDTQKKIIMFKCDLWIKGTPMAYFLRSTAYGTTEEQLFQTVADLYDGTVENFLEKVK